MNGHEGMVKMLLERDNASPDKPDNDDITPLSWAAFYGHEGVVKILLEQDDVNSHLPNRRGQTPRSLAAQNGHEGVVKILTRTGRRQPRKAR